MARIMWIPDLHCSYNDGRVIDGIPARFHDWEQTAQALLRLIDQQKPDLVIAPGDFFVHPRPGWREILAIFELFLAIEQRGVQVIGFPGNHDLPGPSDPGPVDGLAGMAGRPLWGLTTPQIVKVWVCDGMQEVQVAVLPWVKANANMITESAGIGEAVMKTTVALMDIIRALAAQIDPMIGPAVLAGHWGISTCRTANERIMTGQEATIPLGELLNLPFQAVGMGHIHTPQVFPQSDGGPVIFHTGAFERRDFGEEKDERRVAITETDARTIEWFDLPARRFWTWELAEQDVFFLTQTNQLTNGEPARLLLDRVLALKGAGDYSHTAKDAICRVVYQATEEQQAKIDQGALVRALREAGAEHVAGVFPEIIRSERIRAAGLTEHSSPQEALGRWLDMQTDLSEQIRTKAADAFADMLAAAGIEKGGGKA